MSETPISPLRRRMIEDMTVRGFGETTQNDYIRHVKSFTIFHCRAPDQAEAEDLRTYQLHQRGTGVQPPTMNSTVAALRFLFTTTCNQPEMARHLRIVKQPQKLPAVLTPEEVLLLLESAPGPKYRTALAVAFGAFLALWSRSDTFSSATGVKFTNFEYVQGSAFNDVLGLADLGPGHGALTTAEAAARKAVSYTGASLANPSAVQAAYDGYIAAVGALGFDGGRLVVDGGAGNDIIGGAKIGYNEIYGGAGGDVLFAGKYVSELHGGDGSDFVAGGGLKSFLYGDGGADIFNVAADSVEMDATTEDFTAWGPFQLTGGVRQWWMEDGWPSE